MKPRTLLSVQSKVGSTLGVLRTLHWLGAMLSLMALTNTVGAFSLIGPKVGYQADNLGYDRVTDIPYPFAPWTIFDTPEWTYAPHNIGEGYRWNIPTLHYTYDGSFLTYFGPHGVRAVDSAVKILNDVPSASQVDINDYPPDEARFNYTAAALHLYDLKSAALEMLIPRLGLADPERFTWTLRGRILRPGSSCPNYDYTVIPLNFDPDTFGPSRYVNGNLLLTRSSRFVFWEIRTVRKRLNFLWIPSKLIGRRLHPQRLLGTTCLLMGYSTSG